MRSFFYIELITGIKLKNYLDSFSSKLFVKFSDAITIFVIVLFYKFDQIVSMRMSQRT